MEPNKEGNNLSFIQGGIDHDPTHPLFKNTNEYVTEILSSLGKNSNAKLLRSLYQELLEEIGLIPSHIKSIRLLGSQAENYKPSQKARDGYNKGKLYVYLLVEINDPDLLRIMEPDKVRQLIWTDLAKPTVQRLNPARLKFVRALLNDPVSNIQNLSSATKNSVAQTTK
jgi:8-oxo-dGTP pyrophosphatase MutT (NUDIX family)